MEPRVIGIGPQNLEVHFLLLGSLIYDMITILLTAIEITPLRIFIVRETFALHQQKSVFKQIMLL